MSVVVNITSGANRQGEGGGVTFDEGTIKELAASTLVNPSTGCAVIFKDTENGKQLSIKDDAGVVTVIDTGAPAEIAYKKLDDGDSPYTALLTDFHFSCNTTSGALSINLPSAAAAGIREYRFKVRNSAGSNLTVVRDGTDTIREVASNLPMDPDGLISSPHITLLSDGVSNWEIVEE